MSQSRSVTTTANQAEPSVRRRWTILSVCCLSLFLVGLDTTIVNVGLPAIGDGLGIGTRGLQWTVDAYTLALAGLLISSGALADRVGRRRVFQLGLILFGTASLACALAPSAGVLIGFRVLQGVGGSMLSPVALAIVVNAITDPRERAQAIGVWAAVFGLSMAIGPVLGGALVSALGWRSVFWVNLPVIVVVLGLSRAFVPESRALEPRRLDLPGQFLLMVLVVASVGVLIEGPHHGWTSAPLLAGYLGTTFAAIGFVRVESRRAEPLIDLSAFRHPLFSAAVLGAITVFVALSTTLLLSTLYLQHTRGLSAAATGVVMLPLALGATVCAPLSGRLVGRVGARMPLALAGGFLAAGGLGLATLDHRTAMARLLTGYLLIGIGFGFANAPITNTAVSGLPAERAGVAGGITSTARQFGAALGIAIAGSMVAGTPSAELAAAERPGWLLVAGCGLIVLALAATAPGRRARLSPGRARGAAR
jgi:EmrB/QacA subfamily drug resistance transporter